MTAIDERSTVTDITTKAPAIPDWPATAGSMPDQPHSGEPARPAPQPRPEGRRSQGEAEFRTVRIARFAATAITALIAIASFVLSFSSLWDLASRSVSWPRDLAWLWPLIVDGVVVVATIAIRALTKTAAPSNEHLPAGAALTDVMTGGVQEIEAQHRRDRAFFWWMLVAAASVS